jgi:hypothetical protein
MNCIIENMAIEVILKVESKLHDNWIEKLWANRFCYFTKTTSGILSHLDFSFFKQSGQSSNNFLELSKECIHRQMQKYFGYRHW